MKEHNKRWLISRMKTSGSKRKYLDNGRYADERNGGSAADFEDLPAHERIRSTRKIYNGKLNYGLLVRFLRGHAGDDWDKVYSGILSRIPTKLLDYRDVIFWFVADKVEYRDGLLYDRKTNRPIWTPEVGARTFAFGYFHFYVCPETNKLIRIGDAPGTRATRNLDKKALREFREAEKKGKLAERKASRILAVGNAASAEALLRRHNQERQGDKPAKSR